MSLSRRDFLARLRRRNRRHVIRPGRHCPRDAGLSRLSAGSTPPQQTPPCWTPTFTPIRRNVGFYMGRGGTIGYLIDKGAVVVVDSQFPDSAKVCLDGLQERSKNHGVDLLINTHHHAITRRQHRVQGCCEARAGA
jgi:hypothetical protein